jgi:hypothetical protein
MYWRDTVAFTGHGSQRFLGVFEAHAAAGQTVDRTATGRQIKRGAIGADIYAESTDDAQLLERYCRTPRAPATTTVPGGTGQRDRLRESRWCPGGYVHDHTAIVPVALLDAATGSSTATSTARPAPNFDASATRSASRGPSPVTITNAAPASLPPRRRTTPEFPAEHSNDVARFGAGNGYSPTYSSSQRVGQRSHHRIEADGHG